jgi:hypothetical protein
MTVVHPWQARELVAELIVSVIPSVWSQEAPTISSSLQALLRTLMDV